MIRRPFVLAAACLLAGIAPTPVLADNPPAWTEPYAPFHVAGPIYYVGSKGLAAYLIRTPDGAILLDGTMPENVAMVEANIRALGLKLSDVKILITSHAHFDHAGGLAGLKRDTGAKLAAMREDVWALENGRHFGDANYVGTFPAVKVDRVLHDGDTVALGGVTMTAVLTPGHTAGCTTWTMTIRVKGTRRAVAFPCSMTVAGARLVGNRAYPGIVADFRRSFARLGAMHPDIVLTAHPEFAHVLERKGSDYVDRTILPGLVTDARRNFDAELARQQAAAAAKLPAAM